MKRNEIDEKYKWNLDRMYLNASDALNDLTKANTLIDEVVSLKGNITSSKENLIKLITLLEELDRVVSKVYVFAKQSVDVDPDSSELQNLYNQAEHFLNVMSEKTVFIDSELGKNIKKVIKYAKSKEFKEYKMFLDSYIRYAPHVRSEEIENILARVSSFSSKPEQIYNTIRPLFPNVIVNGEEKFLNQATLRLFLENRDRSVRYDAYQKYYNKIKESENTYALTLEGNIQQYNFFAKEHNFEDGLSMSLFSDNVDKDFFNSVVNTANDEYKDVRHRFYKLLKKESNLDDFATYDLNVPPVESVDLKYSVEDGIKLIYKALAPLGKNYINDLKKFEEERWVDYMTHEKKRSGAYSWGCYDSTPYIMMNWVGTIDSVSTLAHELGHSMHSYYSHKNNRALNANYKIFVAEVASIVNEVLLNNYLLKKYENNKEVKKYLLYNFLHEINATIFRQTFFADFEKTLYDLSQSGSALSASLISSLYHEKSIAHYGEAVRLPEELKYAAYSVPHFYYHFYVYKYAIGMCVALAIASRILKGDKKQLKSYLKFLTLGGSMYPIEELKVAGIDVKDENLYKDAFNYFASLLDEYEK